MITDALTRFSLSRILYPTLCPLPDIPTSTKSKIHNQIVGKCSIPPYMHFLPHVNLFTKGMDVLNDDRLIRLQYIGLFATNLFNTFYGNSKIPPTHPPKPANQGILQAHSQQLSPLQYSMETSQEYPKWKNTLDAQIGDQVVIPTYQLFYLGEYSNRAAQKMISDLLGLRTKDAYMLI